MNHQITKPLTFQREKFKIGVRFRVSFPMETADRVPAVCALAGVLRSLELLSRTMTKVSREKNTLRVEPNGGTDAHAAKADT